MSRMNKRRLHHYWKYFRQLRPAYFLLAAIVTGAVSVYALRDNNQRMAELRDAVYAADEAGGDVQGALNRLQAHVTAHMNTSLSTGKSGVYPPIQLQHTYKRLVEQQGTQQQGANSELYTRAQQYCQAQNPNDFSGRNRVPCIEQYIQQHGAKTGVTTSTISPSLYQFDFMAPKWSPDLAGWMLFATVLLLLTAVIKLLVDWRLRRILR